MLPWLATVTALATGCTCTAVSNHKWIGPGAPHIAGPADIEKHLRQRLNDKVGAIGRATGFLYSPFKRSGIFGWTDLGCDGEITAIVKQTAKSTDRFCTVDMKLETLRIDGKNISLTADRYLRAEVCLCDVKLPEGELPRAGELIWMRGRMVWDGDGFVEIHPRSTAEMGRPGRRL